MFRSYHKSRKADGINLKLFNFIPFWNFLSILFCFKNGENDGPICIIFFLDSSCNIQSHLTVSKVNCGSRWPNQRHGQIRQGLFFNSVVFPRLINLFPVNLCQVDLVSRFRPFILTNLSSNDEKIVLLVKCIGWVLHVAPIILSYQFAFLLITWQHSDEVPCILHWFCDCINDKELARRIVVWKLLVLGEGILEIFNLCTPNN